LLRLDLNLIKYGSVENGSLGAARPKDMSMSSNFYSHASGYSPPSPMEEIILISKEYGYE
jgi:hypothetical protein